MAYRNTFYRWLFLYSLTFGLTYVLKLFTYLCPETGQPGGGGWTHPSGTYYYTFGGPLTGAADWVGYTRSSTSSISL